MIKKTVLKIHENLKFFNFAYLKMSNFTKIRDLNLRILEDMDDKTLFNYCLTDKYANELCKNEHFFRKRFLRKFTEGQENWREENQSWREYYLMLTYYYDIIRGKMQSIYSEQFGINDNIHEHDFIYFFNLKWLIEICWKLKFYPSKLTPVKVDKEEQIQLLRNFYPFHFATFATFSNKKIEFYYRWYKKTSGEVKIIVRELKSFLKKRDMIIYSFKLKS